MAVRESDPNRLDGRTPDEPLERIVEELMKLRVLNDPLEEVSRRAARQDEPLTESGHLGPLDREQVKLDRAGQILRIVEDHVRREAALREHPDDHDATYAEYMRTLGIEPGSHRRGELS